MEPIRIFTDKDMRIGKVQDEMYSSFLEQLGRAVYEGIYEPGHPAADGDGFRKDVLELVRGLGVPMVRYPGGNFVSGYDWRDGIGPRERRPRRLDLAWKTTETNEFGTDEFMKWCEAAGVRPMMAVNLGTGTPQEAAQLVEYCNHPGGTKLSDLRAANGHPDPYRVKDWCLGNEMDGPWQICHMDAASYAAKAKEAAKMMKLVDGSIRLVGCGSSSLDLPSYPEWDKTVLEELYDVMDMLSMHQYYWYEGDDDDFYASSTRMDDFIHTILSACDFVKAKLRSKKTMMISFDEWNIWYIHHQGCAEWGTAMPILEDTYNLQDAVVFASLMNTLVNHCDRIRCACLAQLVNVISPIRTQRGGAAIRQTTYEPFRMFSRFGRGEALRPLVKAPALQSEKWGDFAGVSCSVVWNEERAEVTAFMCNFLGEDVPARLEVRGFGPLTVAEHTAMCGELGAQNTFAHPDAVLLKPRTDAAAEGEQVRFVLPAQSFSMLRLRCGGEKRHK